MAVDQNPTIYKVAERADVSIATVSRALQARATVHQPIRRLGACAVELLLRRIEDPDADPEVVVLATKLVVRASCGCE